MGAIGGFIHAGGGPDARAAGGMLARLAAYGPDAQASWTGTDAALVAAQLRTTPEAAFDTQPLDHPASGLVLAFDGRIDNRAELAEALALAPARLAGMADSELVLQAWLRWGRDCLPRLVGDFALACHARRTHELWLARDPMGMRPLYWHHARGLTAFASVPRALFDLPGIGAELCAEGLDAFLTRSAGPRSGQLFRDIAVLPPGHCLHARADRVRCERFFAFDLDRELRFARDADYVEAAREQLARAVDCRLRAAGPIAAQLSSGLDSALVTAFAASELDGRGKRLAAFTAVPPPGWTGYVPPRWHADEGPGARAVAQGFANIDHVLVDRPTASLTAVLEREIAAMNAPPLFPCNLAWDDAIRAGVRARGGRVLLVGNKGNLTLSHAGDEALAVLLGAVLAGQARPGDWLRVARGWQRRNNPWRAVLNRSLSPHLPILHRAWRMLRSTAGDGDPAQLPRTARASREWRSRELTGWDAGAYYAGDSAAGIELRDPLADVRLVQFCLAVPVGQYCRAGEPRALALALARTCLPQAVSASRTRGWQGANWGELIDADRPAIGAMLQRWSGNPVFTRHLDVPGLREELAKWPGIGSLDGTDVQRYRFKLLGSISAGLFLETFLPPES